jgi:deoxyribose-phosphate aldolase
MTGLNRYIEHTVLKQGITESLIRDNFELCTEYKLPVFVIPPAMVKFASSLRFDKAVSICTVIGFPLGYSTHKTKLYEISDAIEKGADHIDLVINNSIIKDAAWDRFDAEMAEYRKACSGKILKIIVETSIITRNELDRIAQTLVNNGIDYIKTSTGMVGDGAKLDDVKYLKDYFGNKIKIKASGGIKTKDQVLEFIKAGADRIGTSSAKQILEN